MRRLLALLLLVTVGAAPGLDEATRQAVLAHGPWPPAVRVDPSNRVSGDVAAIAYGQVLFFEAGLSPDRRFACASCHEPARGFADGRVLGEGRVGLPRNTLGLANVGQWRWFGWDGGSDTLWGQSLRPLFDGAEMGADAAHVAGVVRGRADLACRHRGVFGAVGADDLAVSVEVAKALAAFQEILVTPRTVFDAFRDAVAGGDVAGQAAYPAAARRGLALFLGEGQCAACHAGPLFSNREFHDAGVPYFTRDGGVDRGRYGGIERLTSGAFGLLGAFNDAPWASDLRASRHVVQLPRNFGEFRVPSLRGLSGTAPFMHNGSRADLAAVVRHYSELDEERLHADGERLLRPLRLDAQARDDLVAFLETLAAAVPLLVPPPGCRD